MGRRTVLVAAHWGARRGEVHNQGARDGDDCGDGRERQHRQPDHGAPAGRAGTRSGPLDGRRRSWPARRGGGQRSCSAMPPTPRSSAGRSRARTACSRSCRPTPSSPDARAEMDRVGTSIAEAIATSGVGHAVAVSSVGGRPAVRHRADRRAAHAGGAPEAPVRCQRAGAAPRLLLRELPPLARPDSSPGDQRRWRGGKDDPADDRDAGHRGLRRRGPLPRATGTDSRCGSCSARAT